MSDLLNIQIPNDITLNNVLQGKPYLVNIEGSVNICMTLCGQDIEGCNQVEFINMKNAKSLLIMEPKPNSVRKCGIKLAFDSTSDTSIDTGYGNYVLEKLFISVPSFHRLNKQIFDLEVYLVYSSKQKDGSKIYVVMCSLYTGVDSVAPSDWRFVTYKLMNELFGNLDKIPNPNQTMGIGAPPNPIDVQSFIPREGYRNFYEYTHPRNTKVNFRIFSTPMFVSTAVIRNLQSKLFFGSDYTNFKSMIQQSTNPPSGLFIFFSQDVTKNIDSALGGKLLTPDTCPPPVSTPSKPKTDMKKKAKKKIKKGTKTGNSKSNTKSKTKSTETGKSKNKNNKKKSGVESFANQSDDEEYDDDEDEEDEDEEEDFENENEDVEDVEDEDVEEEDEVGEEDTGEVESYAEKKQKSTSASEFGYIIGAIFIAVVVTVLSLFVMNLLKVETNKSILISLTTGFILGMISYYGIKSSEQGTTMKQATKDTQKLDERRPKEDRDLKSDMEKYGTARTAQMFVLGLYIIIPYFFFLLMTKLMNDPRFEGLGNYNFEPNKVAELLGNDKFQNILSSKFWYFIFLFAQVLISLIVFLQLALNDISYSTISGIRLALALCIFSIFSVFIYIYRRSQLPFDNVTVCELDYYSLLSLNIPFGKIRELLFNFGSNPVDIDLGSLQMNVNSNVNNINSLPQANVAEIRYAPIVKQQGGTIENNKINTSTKVPGLSHTNMNKAVQKIMQNSGLEKIGNWDELLADISPRGWIYLTLYVVSVSVISIILTSVMAMNNSSKFNTTGSALGIVFTSFLVIGGIIYKYFILKKPTAEQATRFVGTLSSVATGIGSSSSGRVSGQQQQTGRVENVYERTLGRLTPEEDDEISETFSENVERTEEPYEDDYLQPLSESDDELQSLVDETDFTPGLRERGISALRATRERAGDVLGVAQQRIQSLRQRIPSIQIPSLSSLRSRTSSQPTSLMNESLGSSSDIDDNEIGNLNDSYVFDYDDNSSQVSTPSSRQSIITPLGSTSSSSSIPPQQQLQQQQQQELLINPPPSVISTIVENPDPSSSSTATSSPIVPPNQSSSMPTTLSSTSTIASPLPSTSLQQKINEFKKEINKNTGIQIKNQTNKILGEIENIQNESEKNLK